MALSKRHNTVANAVKRVDAYNNAHISQHGERLTNSLMNCLEAEHEENDKRNIQTAWAINNEGLAKMQEELEEVVYAINKPTLESKLPELTLQESPTPSTSKRKQTSKNTKSKKPKLPAPTQEPCSIPAKQEVITFEAVEGIITMPKVDPLPRMTYWIPIKTNILTPDSEYLTHLPQLPEQPPKSNHESQFLAKLIELYHGKTEDDSFIKQKPEIIRAMILGLTELVKEFGLEILSSNLKSNTACPTDAQILQLAKRMVADNKTSVEPSEIPTAVFAAVASSDPDIGSAEDLQTWFTQTSGEGGNMESKDAYEQQFCDICFSYKCLTHTGISENNIATIHRQPVLPGPYFLKSYRNSFKCKFLDCIKKNGNRTFHQTKKHHGAHSSTGLTNDWSEDDIAYCKCLFKTYQDECFVAFIMQSKTCNQVRKLIETSGSSGGPPVSVPIKNATVPCCSTTRAQTNAVEPNKEDAKKYEKPDFIPCSHKGNCGKNCPCAIRRVQCEKFCGCSKECSRRFNGCTCSTTCSTKNCPCFIALRECDPDLCDSCGSKELDTTKATCCNMGLQTGKASNLLLGVSTVSGWGAFAKRDIMEGELVSEYVGEIVSDTEADKRGFVYDERKHTYLFSLNNGFSVDGTNFGGKTRFMNSSETPNCEPKKMLVNGESRIGIYATEDISQGDELFFNYHEIIKND
ncbi:Histone-lysine N-methyltransferase EZH2 [Orchesella cincta]|uniref:[histone H3]-lysine(27) N-trimethyltransferase n=1 Tax=Orchesella cincta TaxID=48709 RepID=A0A1D2N5E2_ORCCI|nr:Histone-lysine N-methyltransferase EZH2 [Orchesella cincta]